MVECAVADQPVAPSTVPAADTQRLTVQQLGIGLGLVWVFGALLIVWATSAGIGVSTDSTDYVSAARNLLAGNGLTTYEQTPLTIFPPGLPFLLAALMGVGLSAEAAGLVLNLIGLAGTILFSALIALVLRLSNAIALMVGAFCGLAHSVIFAATSIWTESLFTAFAMAALWLAVRAVSRRQLDYRIAVGLGLLVSCATLLRFAGVVLIPAVAVAAWLATKSSSGQRGISSSHWPPIVLTVLIASAGTLIVAARNWTLGVGAFGERTPSGIDGLTVAEQVTRTMGRYLAPQAIDPDSTLALALGAGVIAITFASMIVAFASKGPAAVLAIYVAAYWLLLIQTQFAAVIDEIDERLVAPVIAPTVILVVWAVARMVKARVSPQAKTPRLAVAGLAVLAALIFEANVIANLNFAGQAAANSQTHNQLIYKQSPLMDAIKALPDDATLASNETARVYWLTGRDTQGNIPQQGEGPHFVEAVRTADYTGLAGKVQQGKVDYLAFFYSPPSAYQPADFSGEHYQLELAEDLADGRLYRVVPRPPG